MVSEPARAHPGRERSSARPGRERPRARPGRKRPRARPDLGKILMLPVVSAVLVLDLAGLANRMPAGGLGSLRWLGVALTCAFYVQVIVCYLRRAPAVASSASVTANAAAVIATLIPFALPLLHGGPPGAGRAYASDGLLLAGTVWAIWSVRSLGRSLSVIAQAREVVEKGPYRWVRHPLYAGEIVSALGLAVAAGTPAAMGAWIALCALQGYRALREEQILLHALPAYRSYRSRTSALVPGVF